MYVCLQNSLSYQFSRFCRAHDRETDTQTVIQTMLRHTNRTTTRVLQLQALSSLEQIAAMQQILLLKTVGRVNCSTAAVPISTLYTCTRCMHSALPFTRTTLLTLYLPIMVRPKLRNNVIFNFYFVFRHCNHYRNIA